MSQQDVSEGHADGAPPSTPVKVRWYRSTFYNMTILGLCNLSAPGIWTAMNSLGGGGAEEPYLVNTSNALTFCLMVVSCWLSSTLVRYIGIKGALIFGTQVYTPRRVSEMCRVGYAPYAAGLYVNNRYDNEWLILLGAALCGISAGVFWSAEAAIAIAYPEPWNRGRALGYWLTFRISGQVIGGAINLGLNANRNTAGKVSYTVFEVFIALQAAGPVVALFLNRPHKVQRTDGKPVSLAIEDNLWVELKRTTEAFLSPKFLLIILLIGQAVFAEAVFFTYLSLWFSVRGRALGSFLSGIVAAIGGNLLGLWLDRTSISLKTRARVAFLTIVTLQGAWWTWATILVTRYHKSKPTYDWVDEGFGAGFGVFIFLTLGFQLNYMFLYFVIQNISKNEKDVIRYAAVLRGTESAWQAVSYGVTSITIIARVGGVYINYGLWAAALFPAWLVIRHIGSSSNVEEESHDGSGSISGGDKQTSTTVGKDVTN
ncbi:Ion channel regulatory protein UNC-93 [Geosmithia morbida]|uniref:Ion channel regulatory protein UNC-93 n=1 Tax=Geosmithia morbida TaxID=1094350 RepID=A0A9P5D102_9HYPO|nr:Ion channel regulatory protein UNC-93 [Geosmithia morbida]KAF4119956.1 Ion channel regulatory protein UNC-93 [Geosmithia morbida]